MNTFKTCKSLKEFYEVFQKIKNVNCYNIQPYENVLPFQFKENKNHTLILIFFFLLSWTTRKINIGENFGFGSSFETEGSRLMARISLLRDPKAINLTCGPL
jgi:hypothetical protein